MNASYKQVTKARYIARVAELAEEIFPAVYSRLGGKNGLLLAQKYQSDDLTEDEIRSGVNYFLIYLGSREVGYFALDLSPAGALCISRLYLCADVRGRGIGRGVITYAQRLAEGDGRTRLFMPVWARDLQAEAFCKKRGFRPAGIAPVEVLPGVTMDIKTWEKLWR